ncbi:MAG: nucleoside-diphosphate kinase [Candidatus Dependentiae bacterium]|nr:nucleoside-diphosphate kinase [Candidatus Dependentiae bacterium]
MNFIRLILLTLCIMPIVEIHSKDSLQYTFAMIKPNAVKQQKAEEIIHKIEKAGFTIVAMKKMTLTPQKARELYQEHKHCSWFPEYIKIMTASPVIVMVLKKNNAMAAWDQYKKIIRATYYAMNMKTNIVHGSDSVKAAKREIALFFKDLP